MSVVTAIAIVFAKNEPVEAEGATVLMVQADDIAANASRLLMTIDRPVLVLNGASMLPGWLDPMLELLTVDTIVSPWVRMGNTVGAYGVDVCPYAFLAHASTLITLGGLTGAFHSDRLLTHRARQGGIRLVNQPAAVCSPYDFAARTEITGSRYYDQIAEMNTIDDLIGAEQ